jgi:hypothetical protein
MYLNVYVPRLQSERGIVGFFREHRGQPLPSAALMSPLRLVDAYATMLADPDPTVRDNAAREWCTWQEAQVCLTPGHTPNPRYRPPEFRLRFARLVARSYAATTASLVHWAWLGHATAFGGGATTR